MRRHITPTVDTIAQFTHKSASAAWLSRHWLAWSDTKLGNQSMFNTLEDTKARLSDFEKRCAEALGALTDKSNPSYSSVQFDADGNLTYRSSVVHDAVRGKLTSARAEANYRSMGTALNRDHEIAYTLSSEVAAQHRTLKEHTARFYTLFGYESPEGTYSSYLDEARESDRERWLDASFVEREMPGHDRFVCPVCANVAKDGQVGDSSVTQTGYVDPCCRNFDCPNYGQPLQTLARFQEWLSQGAIDTLALTRAEYQAEFGWDAKEMHKGAASETRYRNARRSPVMRDIIRYATKTREAVKRHLPGTQTWTPMCASWELIGPRMPKQGDFVRETCVNVDVNSMYWRETVARRTLTLGRLVANDVHRNVVRGRNAATIASRKDTFTPERWGETEDWYLNNAHAMGVRSTGSLVVARH